MVMPGDVLVMDSIATAPPSVRKSAIRRFVENALGRETSMQALSKSVAYAREGAHVMRSGGEALVTGAALGWLSGERGSLDTKLGPIDGWLAGAGLVGSILMAGDPYGISQDARNVGSNALSILTFRKMEAWKKKQAKNPATVAGEERDMGDPILNFAAKLL